MNAYVLLFRMAVMLLYCLGELSMVMCVCVCVCEREREREREL